MRVLRAADRFETTQPGILTRHCFSAGQHYDPANLSFGPLLGVDEHLLAPGAGFDEHAHRGVEIVSWVLAGALRHSNDAGDERLVTAGSSLRQDAAAGIRHTERNASDTEPLHFVQLTLISDEHAPRVSFDVLTKPTGLTGSWLHLFVAAGRWRVGAEELGAGDSVRADGPLHADGYGELLVLCLT